MKIPKRTLSEMQQMTADANSIASKEVNALELLRLEMLTSFEKYTRAMFKSQYKKSFIVAEHHKKIISALQDVVDGIAAVEVLLGEAGNHIFGILFD